MPEIEGLFINLVYPIFNDAEEPIIYEPDEVPTLNESEGYPIRNPVCWEVLFPLRGDRERTRDDAGVVADNREEKRNQKKKKQRTSKRIYIGNLEGGGSKKSRVGKAERDGGTNYRCAL